jgi:hypothetical protein
MMGLGLQPLGILRDFLVLHGGEIAAKLVRSGFERHVQSWTGAGEDLTVEAEDIKNILGIEELARLGKGTGVSIDHAAEVLAQYLPKVIKEQAQYWPSSMDDAGVIEYFVQRGADIFGSREDAEQWLRTPALGLSYRRPIDLLKTQSGIEELSNFFNQIKYGVYV